MFTDFAAEAARVAPTGADIEFVGPRDPIYPSPLALGAGVAGQLGLIAGVIDDIRHAQTGRRQHISIDVGHAVTTISSMWLLTVDGELAISRFSLGAGPALVTNLRCRDGRYLYTLSGFPHIVERTLEVLGCGLDDVAETVAQLDSSEIERRLVEAQLTAVVIRDHDEWLATPQGKLVGDLPAVEIERIGDAPPVPFNEGDLPLSGLRMIDSTRVLAGPTIARTLAAVGADVLHVGSPNVPDMEAAQADTGHGKRRAHVDLATSEGEAVMWQLIDSADVFSQSYRAQSIARRGFSPEAVAARRPGIIYVSENAYGQLGPWREKRGFDGNVQAATGIYSLTQSPEDGIVGQGPAMAMNDYGTGYWGAYGVLEALRRRATEGGSWHVKVSLAQTAHWFMRMGTPHAAANAMDSESIIELAGSFTEHVDSDYGELGRLAYPIHFSDITPKWGRTVRPGSHAPTW